MVSQQPVRFVALSLASWVSAVDKSGVSKAAEVGEVCDDRLPLFRLVMRSLQSSGHW